jgi:hypothetical protein
MRAFVLVPILLLIAFAAAIAVCRAAGVDAHLKDLFGATITCLVAGELAAVPMLLTRHADNASVAQAALVGTVLHLFVCIGIAAAVVFGHAGLGTAYLYWLLLLYWVTLIALVIAFIKAMRAAPISQTSRQQGI